MDTRSSNTVPGVAGPTGAAARRALDIYAATLQAVAADRLVAEKLRVSDDVLCVGDHELRLGPFRRIFVVGAGKAATPMAQAVERQLGSRLDRGVVVTKHGHAGNTDRVQILEAGHPVPDTASIKGGEAVAQLAAAAGYDDLVIVLISGGASALMELPLPGVTLDDIQITTDLLLRSGAVITEVNAVRARLSQLKHGGLARLIAPARAVCLVLSDVLGSPLNSIGSGPCWIGASGPTDAESVLRKYGLLDHVPQSVAAVTRNPQGAPIQDGAASEPIHVLIGDIWTALDAAAARARELGHHPLVITGMMQGEAREIGLTLAGAARDLPRLKAADGVDCLLLGGETTVTVRGSGLGGRCQEMACAAIPILAHSSDVCLLTDGPTDAAGAVVDGTAAVRAQEAGLSPEAALAHSSTYSLLDRIGCLIRTGPTGSNVGDIAIALQSN